MTVRSAFYGLLNSSTMINKDGGLYNCLASNIINSLQRGMKIIAILYLVFVCAISSIVWRAW